MSIYMRPSGCTCRVTVTLEPNRRERRAYRKRGGQKNLAVVTQHRAGCPAAWTPASGWPITGGEGGQRGA